MDALPCFIVATPRGCSLCSALCFLQRRTIERDVLCQYSRSPKIPALQLLQKSSKSASTTPQRLIWNTFGTVAVRDFWENLCNSSLSHSRIPLLTTPSQVVDVPPRTLFWEPCVSSRYLYKHDVVTTLHRLSSSMGRSSSATLLHTHLQVLMHS